MNSIIDVINLALANLSNNNFIESLDEENPEAIQAKVRWAIVLNSVLAAYPWDFASTTETLALLPEQPGDTAWRFHYMYPGDCLVVRRAFHSDHPIIDAAFRQGTLKDNSTKTILANINPLCVEYTRKDVRISNMPPHFINALAWRLAAEIALAQRADQNQYALAIQTYGMILEEAKVADANERGPIAPVIGNWQRSRHG